METLQKINITVDTTVNAPIEIVWDLFTEPRHIVHWYSPSGDWHTPRAESDTRAGGKFLFRMEAKNGSEGFDFTGKYIRVEPPNHLEILLDDDRKVKVDFFTELGKTRITETFETENSHSAEQQHDGWQAILDNFRKYVEKYGEFEILHFEVNINCNAEKVFKTITDPGTFREWTTEFNPSSHYEGSWEKGSRIKFLGTNQNGVTEGMISRIREIIPNKFISIEHIGIVQNDTEIIRSENIGWKDLLENYNLTETDGKTLLSVDVDSDKDFRAYFMETWPKALEKLKSICERSSR
jgi:uncharacterized protein YndB with AHSA1/START domain